MPRRNEPLPPAAEYCCADCGYDRSGAPESEHCPECGAPATSSRWIVRGQRMHSPLLPAVSGAVVMLLVLQRLYGIPPELFLPLQAVTLLIMIQMLRRPYRATLCVAPEGLSLRWGFGPAMLMPTNLIRCVRFLVAPGVRLQRTGRTVPNKWMLEVVAVAGANLMTGPRRTSADDDPAASAQRRSWSARIASVFRPWGMPPGLIIKGPREDVVQLEQAINRVIRHDPANQR